MSCVSSWRSDEQIILNLPVSFGGHQLFNYFITWTNDLLKKILQKTSTENRVQPKQIGPKPKIIKVWFDVDTICNFLYKLNLLKSSS